MPLNPETLAVRYDDPTRKSDRIEVSADRYRRAMERGDDGAWGVGALVADGDAVLYVREGDTWLLPGGRLEPDESPEEGARREVREETGVEVEITGLGAIAEQTFVREGSDDAYEFYFATFFGEPTGDTAVRPGEDVDAVSWRSEVPEETFDRGLVTRLIREHV